LITRADQKQFSWSGRNINLLVPAPDQVLLQSGSGAEPLYWARLWPAAQALARYLIEHAELTFGKDVIELGAGLGLPSLATAANARSVLCTDLQAEAILWIQRSAAVNGINNLEARLADWNDELPFHPGLLLLSDVNYDPAKFGGLQRRLYQWMDAGIPILLSTPQRLTAREFVQDLLPYVKETWTTSVDERGTTTDVTVLFLHH